MLQKYLQKFFIQKTPATKHYNFLHLSPNEQHIHKPCGKRAFTQNVIVNRCINLIASAAGHVPREVYRAYNNHKQKHTDHPANRLLKHPSPTTSGFDFFYGIIANKLLFGNSYLLATLDANTIPTEIYLLPTSDVTVLTDKETRIGYKYWGTQGEIIYRIDPVTQCSKVLHLKNYNPHNQLYGLPCIEAAATSIELHNRSTEWNNSLLKNGARPSGALVVKDNSGYLTDEQFERLREQLNEKYTGASNSGKPLLLEGGLDWKEMSINPKDMDFIESKNTAAREIALAFGVPPQLLGIQGDNTYSNMQEARLALWEETILPMLDNLSDALSHWLSHWYNEDLLITFDHEAISALTEKRQNLWNKLNSANFMTINEKRTMVGLPPTSGGDKDKL